MNTNNLYNRSIELIKVIKRKAKKSKIVPLRHLSEPKRNKKKIFPFFKWTKNIEPIKVKA